MAAATLDLGFQQSLTQLLALPGTASRNPLMALQRHGLVATQHQQGSRIMQPAQGVSLAAQALGHGFPETRDQFCERNGSQPH